MPFVRRRRILLPDSHSSMRSLMIARTWHGVTATSKADAYFQVLQDTGLKEYRDTPGNQGGIVLRNGRGCDSFPPDHILGIVRCDPPLCGPESGAFRVLSGRQGVPPRVRADRDALRRPRVAGRMALTTRTPPDTPTARGTPPRSRVRGPL